MTQNAKVWGPHVWNVIHQIVFSIPQDKNLSEAEKRVLSNFLKTIKNLLPCPVCRTHYSNLLVKMSYIPHLKTGKSISNWTVSAHNNVNSIVGNKQFSYETALKLYSSPINPSDFSNFITYILLNSAGQQPFARRKLVATCVSLLYPSLKHREKMEEHLQNYKALHSIKTEGQFRDWLNRLRKIAFQKL